MMIELSGLEYIKPDHSLDMEAVDKFRESMTPEQVAAFDTIRELLWVQYPRKETLDRSWQEDSGAIVGAMCIMDGLRIRGVGFVRLS